MIVVVGLSHHSAPLDVRECFAVAKDAQPLVLAKLSARPELAEALFLSTCNRVEIVARPKQGGDVAMRAAGDAVRAVMREHAPAIRDLDAYLYEKSGAEAVRHIFRVAASLDSMVLGEPQILGQVKEAYDVAAASGGLRGPLGRCFHRAFSVAKRVRTETQIGAGMVSISSVAVDLAKSIFGPLETSTVLLIGAGEMAEAAAKALGKNALRIRVVNRSAARAFELAANFGGAAAPLDALEAELAYADVVIASTGSPHYVVTRDIVKRAMRARRGRTLLFVDIAVPRNVDPSIHDIDNVFVYDVDDLQAEVARTMQSRTQEAQQAETIVEEELRGFLTWAQTLKLQPLVVGLRARTKTMLTAELERSLAGKLKHLTADDRSALHAMIESATSKLLHAPLTRLKEASGTDDEGLFARATAELFNLSDDDVSTPSDHSAPSLGGAHEAAAEASSETETAEPASRTTH
jgi:glutamyl-tRNA reductase